MFISRKIIILAVLFLLPILGMAEQVTEEWVARFNGSSIDSYDKPVAMAVDSNGDVYVTGSSTHTGSTGKDIVTIKYNSNGSMLWSDRYNGSDNLGDSPADLKVDSEGNVYVAGYSIQHDRSLALLIKYDSDTGNRRWVKHTNYSGHDRERIQSIVLDSLGNIYTAAYATSGSIYKGAYFISKYNKEGEFIRVYITPFLVETSHSSFHDSPLNLAVDSLDNIYMIGSAIDSETGADFLTIKFDFLLNVEWTRKYNNADNGDDRPTSVAIDENDNIYVSGGSSATSFLAHYLTIKYNSSGDQQWVIHEPDSVGTTNDLFVKDTYFYVTGDKHDTIKYSSDGSRIWKQRLAKPAEIDESTGFSGHRITVNDLGEVFTLSRTHLVTTKYDENGNEQWSKHFEGESDQLEFSSTIATYGDSVYVTGLSAPSGNRGYDYVTIKYSMTFDTDGDGVDNTLDNCPSIANPSQLNTDGDAQGNACDLDDDNDGVNDAPDNCPLIANSDQLNTDGDAQGNACDPDDDNDGVNDAPDNCPLNANSDQLNTDGDAQGNACDLDDDNDGVNDAPDNCPLIANSGQLNTDGDAQGNACDPDDDNDGVSDAPDNCPLIPNSDQLNTDGDAQGNACDLDDDNDGVNDAPDNCPLIANSGQLNTDGDAQGNACDPDDDNDGVNDAPDNCPLIANSDQLNTDGDAQGNACDLDDDGDGVDDAFDSCPLEDSTGLDADHDGCIDTVSGLVDTLDTLVSEGTIAEEMSNSLRQKINRAIATAGRDNLCAAINQLESFKNQVEAQRGKKVSDETAGLLTSYSDNLISGFEADLGAGESCN